MINILLIEDNPGDARLIQEMINELKPNKFKIIHTENLNKGIRSLIQTKFQIILLDLSLPDSYGLETLSRMLEKALNIPIIVFTGTDDQILAINALKYGAQDYLIKGKVDSILLERSIYYAIERHNIKEEIEKAREKYRHLFESSPYIIWLLDLNGNIVNCNSATKNFIIEYSPEEIIGKNFMELLALNKKNKKLLPFFKNILNSIIKGKIPKPIELQLYKLYGNKFWLYIQYSLIKLENENLIQIIMQDITERKKAEKNLFISNRAFKMLSECNLLLSYVKNESELLQKICKVVVETGNYQLAWVGLIEDDEKKTVRPVAQAGFEDGYLETVNITWADTERGQGPTGTAIRTYKPCMARNILIDPKYKPWREQAIKRGYKSAIALPLIIDNTVIGTLNIYSGESNAYNKDEVNLLKDLANNLAFGIEKLRSYSKRIEAEQKLKTSEENLRILNEELEQRVKELAKELAKKEKLAFLGEIAGAVGHELRNPLAAIKNNVYYLSMILENPKEDLTDTLKSFDEDINRMNKIISDLLDYSRIRPLNYISINVNNVIDDLLSRLDVPENISVDKNFQEIISNIFVDKIRFEQILTNLITNAFEAMEYGGELTIRISQVNDEIEICIKDTGKGIASNNLKKIFEPFFTTKAKGFGLGLAIVKRYTNEHNGTILVQSQLGQGTTFKLKFPINKKINTLEGEKL